MPQPRSHHQLSRDQLAPLLQQLIEQHDTLDVPPFGEQESSGASAELDLFNYPGEGFRHLTAREWRALPAALKGTWLEFSSNHRHAPHRVRILLLNDSIVPVYVVDEPMLTPPHDALVGLPSVRDAAPARIDR